jgi:hypothetical protein
MAFFITEKDIEGKWLALETRNLPMPDGTLKPFTGFKLMWHSYDYLAISGKWPRNRLVELAIKNSEEVGSTFEDSFPTTLAYLHQDLRKKQGID